MSDESDDKTEAPTPHRLEKAREEGQIPRSRELTSLLILLVGVSVIWFGGVSLARRPATGHKTDVLGTDWRGVA